jgi:hypothetical protein
VPDLETNHLIPGAVGDHLTSTGGNLHCLSQTSRLRWLEARATGKFPNVGLLMRRYLDGETLIEGYWKSVAMPGQGIFIGEPPATVSR